MNDSMAAPLESPVGRDHVAGTFTRYTWSSYHKIRVVPARSYDLCFQSMLTRRSLIKALVFVSVALFILIFKFSRARYYTKLTIAVRGKENRQQSENTFEDSETYFLVQEDIPTHIVSNQTLLTTKHTEKVVKSHKLSNQEIPKPDTLQIVDRSEDDVYPKSNGNFTMYGDGNCGTNKAAPVLEKLFKAWIKLAAKEKIEFFLTCGTLLGAFRNGDLIPHDTDMDILVNRSDFPKIKKYRTKKSFSGYEEGISIYVNKDFNLPYSKRRRYTCRGKV